VLVVNSTGELSSLYKRATLAFVGKSLRGQGGQNFIEAAPVGTPIVVGPNMQNFKVITREFINQQAVVQVTDEFELANCLHALFASDEIRRELGDRARATFEANLGAAQRTAQVILAIAGKGRRKKESRRRVGRFDFNFEARSDAWGRASTADKIAAGKVPSRASRQSQAAFCNLEQGVSTKKRTVSKNPAGWRNGMTGDDDSRRSNAFRPGDRKRTRPRPRRRKAISSARHTPLGVHWTCSADEIDRVRKANRHLAASLVLLWAISGIFKGLLLNTSNANITYR
jgi:hypothetical protein